MRLVAFLLLSTFLSGYALAQDGMDIDFDQVPTVHFPDGKHIVSAYPAFEDYMYMFFDICDAIGFSVENECHIYPMNAD
ncbi:hypothetical protein NKH57_29430 [Mesorhizobium sp. M1050]|uniref:hypothetical protein n=1 Tax=Mesorhizobium sp. M1050 TaxID=2957051 RepID=UPI003339B1D5